MARIGFTELERQLAKRKGVTNPAGLAAYIGRKKLGVAAFNARAARGRRGRRY